MKLHILYFVVYIYCRMFQLYFQLLFSTYIHAFPSEKWEVAWFFRNTENRKGPLTEKIDLSKDLFLLLCTDVSFILLCPLWPEKRKKYALKFSCVFYDIFCVRVNFYDIFLMTLLFRTLILLITHYNNTIAIFNRNNRRLING